MRQSRLIAFVTNVKLVKRNNSITKAMPQDSLRRCSVTSNHIGTLSPSRETNPIWTFKPCGVYESFNIFPGC